MATWRRLLRQDVARALSLARAKAGSNIAASNAAIAITTSSSMRVKARWPFGWVIMRRSGHARFPEWACPFSERQPHGRRKPLNGPPQRRTKNRMRRGSHEHKSGGYQDAEYARIRRKQHAEFERECEQHGPTPVPPPRAAD